MAKEKNTCQLYHYQGGLNHLEGMNDLDAQKLAISTFLLTSNSLRAKHLAIFIGSGCSTPTIPMMGTTMKNILQNPINQDVKDKVVEFINNQEKDVSEFNDIEGLLNWLQSGIQFEKEDDKKEKLVAIFEKIKIALIESIPKYDHINYKQGFCSELYTKFYQKIFSLRNMEDKLSIFTTNYDLFNEYALEDNNVAYSTGFTTNLRGSFDSNQFKYRLVDDTERYKDKWQPVKKSANLFKLHGSINWIQSEDSILVQSNKNSNENIVIYPTLLKHKETALTPYSELFREFANYLQKQSTTLLVMGYGFPDEHINNVIAQNLRNPDFNLIIFGNKDEGKIKEFYNRFKDNVNFHVIGGVIEENRIYGHHFDFIVNQYLTEEVSAELDEKNA